MLFFTAARVTNHLKWISLLLHRIMNATNTKGFCTGQYTVEESVADRTFGRLRCAHYQKKLKRTNGWIEGTTDILCSLCPTSTLGGMTIKGKTTQIPFYGCINPFLTIPNSRIPFLGGEYPRWCSLWIHDAQKKGVPRASPVGISFVSKLPSLWHLWIIWNPPRRVHPSKGCGQLNELADEFIILQL